MCDWTLTIHDTFISKSKPEFVREILQQLKFITSTSCFILEEVQHFICYFFAGILQNRVYIDQEHNIRLWHME